MFAIVLSIYIVFKKFKKCVLLKATCEGGFQGRYTRGVLLPEHAPGSHFALTVYTKGHTAGATILVTNLETLV